MKTSGIIRRIDDLGRIVVPKSMCKVLQIKANDELDITMEGERIILQKHRNGCVFCGGAERILVFNGRKICAACVEKLKEMN